MSANSFPPTSRYAGIEVGTLEDAAGVPVVYLRRRFVPPPERFSLLQLHKVVDSDRNRLDNITAKYLDDPEQFWRVCDANRAMRPDELTETVGRWLIIALPEGIPGVPDA